ncbi:hypothetical protein PF049_00170 [Erythrobacteraceae bacterium WH01K]|nr:hypothetical protein PF049_00170 [Erythrobacteraceae bacterium WH01K]
MANTRLSDIIVPSYFTSYLNEAVTKKSALVSSGAIVRSSMLDQYANGPGAITNVPNFSEFDYTNPDVATDDDTVGDVNAIGTAQQIAQKDFLAKAWGTAAITNSVSGEDILRHAAQNVAAPYWAQTIQTYALAKLSGVIKDNEANDGGDMVLDVSDADGDNATADNKANIDTIIEARQSLGDAADKLSVIIMPSRVYSNLLKLEPHNCAPASETRLFNTYLGHTVIVDDGMPTVDGGTSGKVFTSYLLGAGALLLGEGTPEFGSVVVEREEDQGNNYGLEKLITRKKMILHPQGFASSATVSANRVSPSLASYDAASAWDRVMNRKNVPIVALRTNG